MKIALVSLAWHDHGGIERCVTALAKRLLKRGAEVHVFAASFEGEAPKGLHFHKVPVVARPWSLKILSFAFAAPRMVRREGPFDIVHAHTVYAGACDVATAHSVHRVAMRYHQKPSGLPGVRETLLGLSPLILRVSDLVYRKARLRLAISRVIQDELTQTYGPGPQKLLYYGVDFKNFSPASISKKRVLRKALGLEEDRFWFCFSGWNWRRKGLDTVLQALQALPDKASLLVIGEDVTEGAWFREQAKDMGARVRFAGRQNHPGDWMRACDAFVFPTRYEPFGMVVSEAMACGLAVICPQSAGASEAIKDGRKIQVLAKAGDSGLLEKSMRAFLKTGSAKKLGTMNLKAIRAMSWDRHADETWRIYRSLKGKA